ncbi:hypothetical protein LVJ94_07375 [Pendulispora rubella]|uniref:2-oxoglutarate-dependent ethylene/succinate-forming enzyme n=1 Tax=Pendulispora rubella TaxID=2741070 RepID=A0ABZ2L837_9BACT
MKSVEVLNEERSAGTIALDLAVVDLAKFEAAEGEERAHMAAAFDKGMREIGFGVITGHGLPAGLFQRVLDVTRGLFDLPLTEKAEISSRVAEGQFCGWVPFAADAASRVYGAKSDTPADLRERFRAVISNCDEVRQKVGPNQWPQSLPEVRETWTEYYKLMEHVGARVMRLAAASLGLSDWYFDEYFQRHFSVMMATHSPPFNGVAQPGQSRCGAHTDTGTMTFVYQPNTRGGLEVQIDGQWRVPMPPEGSFVVNCGDLLARWTNDRWRSTVHRVGGPGAPLRERRQSLVFFHQPALDVKLHCVPTCTDARTPPRYAPITLREHFTHQQQLLATRDVSIAS